MTKSMLVDPPGLRNAKQQLAALKLGGAREVARLMSLAECNFRLAVHPDCDSGDAVALLRESVRLDGSNPKYAYHLGRIYLSQGEFELAARWFRLACCLVPTSHRIWAHISVLLREMNSLYYGDEAYEANALRDRSRAVAKAIQDGNDKIDPELLDFVPPRSRAAEEREAREGRQTTLHAKENERDEMRPSEICRYLNANKCRWSGIEHLFIEQMLEGRATQANVRTMAPILSDLADRSHRFPGRPAAVAILCVQWLIRGYPVETVRRILPTFPEANVSTRTLEHVCAIFEAPAEELPIRLQRAVEWGQIPPVTASLIHRQRLLWHPLEYRSLNAYRAARNLLKNTNKNTAQRDLDQDEGQQVELRDLLRRIDRSIAAMNGSPPKSLKDETGAAGSGYGANGAPPVLDLLRSTEQTVQQLIGLKDEAFRLIKEGLDQATKDLSLPSTVTQCIADRQCAGDFTRLLAEATEENLKRCEQLAHLGASNSDEELASDFAARCEDCVTKLQNTSNLGKFSKVLKRIDKRLSAAPDPHDGKTNAVAEWSTILSALQAATNPPSPLATGDASSPADRILEWEEASNRAQEQVDADWIFLKACVSQHKSDELTEEGKSELAAIKSRFLIALDSTEQRNKAISELRNAGTLAGEDVDRLDAVEKQCLKILKVRGKFLKNFAKLPALPDVDCSKSDGLNEDTESDNHREPTTSVSGEPACEGDSHTVDGHAGSRHQAPGRFGNGSPVPHSPPPAPPRPVEELSPHEQLRYALARTDWAIDEMFHMPNRTLEHYPQWIRMLPPFERLQRHIVARQAETMYRLGNRAAARTIWHRLLRTNRLNADALKNIAICDLVQGDTSRSLQSWRDYAELLYLYGVLVDSPKLYATARAEFHRIIGNTYAPGFLSAKLDGDWKDKIDAASLISFLSSAGRFRSYIDHRLLEYVNARFTFESPSLILGIKRVEAESHTDAAEQVMKNFANAVSELLPKRMRRAFKRVIDKTLSDAADSCRDTNQLTLQAMPNYEQEEKNQIELLVRMFDIKLKLYLAFQQNIDLVKNVTSLDFMAELSRLDQIPLKVSPGLVPVVANTMGVDEELLLELSSNLRMSVVAGLLKYLLADDDDAAETPIRERQYRLLTGTWLKREEFREAVRLVDSPFQLMPERLLAAHNQGQQEITMPIFTRWCDRYPAMASITIIVAMALIERKEYDEARRLLEQSRPVALHQPSRRQISYLLVQLLVRDSNEYVENMDGDGVLRVGIEMIELDDFQLAVVEQTIGVYKQLRDAGAGTNRREALREALERWISRATALASSTDEYEGELPRPTAEEIEKARGLLQDEIG